MKGKKEGGVRSPLVSVILAGGGGKRLFPISTERHPKYLLRIKSKRTLLEESVQRAEIASRELGQRPRIFVICNRKQVREVRRILGSERYEILSEPMSKNTAPAICYSALVVRRRVGEDAVMLVMPSDHKIEPLHEFATVVRKGYSAALDGHIVTFGIRPTYPETGYGYIEVSELTADGVFRVRKFTEKPNLEDAKTFLEKGNFFWNSGIFMFRVSTILRELETHTGFPTIMSSFKLEDAYKRVRDISIDYAVCERSDNVVCVPAEFSWSDVGSFRAMKHILGSDPSGNSGNAIFLESEGCFYISEGGSKKRVIFFGMKDMAVVEGEEFILVLPLERDQEVKKVAESVSGGKERK